MIKNLLATAVTLSLVLAAFSICRPATADTCAARPGEFYLWSTPGAEPGALISNAHIVGDAVPAGERWVIRAAGISSHAGNQAEYMLEIAHPVASSNDACCWLVPVARSVGKPDGTPVLALDRELTLLAGERLGARANGFKLEDTFALTYVYWAVPASCVAISTYAPR